MAHESCSIVTARPDWRFFFDKATLCGRNPRSRWKSPAMARIQPARRRR